MEKAGTPDLAEIRARVRGTGGKQYWRSLEALAETPEFQQYLHREFPENATEWIDPVGRRSFLKLMSASLALAGVSAACTVQPDELIVPYVRQPEEEIPGRPLFYATAMTLGGVATGLLVESHEGRPTKVEGNPDHPGSLGATDLYAQASLLTLYDPDRSQSIRAAGRNSSLERIHCRHSREPVGAGRDARRGPAHPDRDRRLADVRAAAAADSCRSSRREVDSVGAGSRRRQRPRRRAPGAGQYLQPVYDFTKADIVLSLDADFLSSEGAANLRYSRQFTSRRRLDAQPDRLNRLYVAEPTPSVTGSNADHRIPLKASAIDGFARAIAAKVGARRCRWCRSPAGTEAYVNAIAEDLLAHRGTSLVRGGRGAAAGRARAGPCDESSAGQCRARR